MAVWAVGVCAPVQLSGSLLEASSPPSSTPLLSHPPLHRPLHSNFDLRLAAAPGHRQSIAHLPLTHPPTHPLTNSLADTLAGSVALSRPKKRQRATTRTDPSLRVRLLNRFARGLGWPQLVVSWSLRRPGVLLLSRQLATCTSSLF